MSEEEKIEDLGSSEEELESTDGAEQVPEDYVERKLWEAEQRNK